MTKKSILFLLAILVMASGANGDTSRYTWASANAGGNSEGPVLNADPYLGDWEGEWTTDKGTQKSNPAIRAQVIPRGKGVYHVNLVPDFDKRCLPFAIIEARVEGGSLRFDEAGWKGMFSDGTCTGTGDLKGSEGAFQLKKVTRLSKTNGMVPPAGAVVLFNSGDFAQWQRMGKPGEILWALEGGAMQIIPGEKEKRHGLETKQGFGDCMLHIEFRLPLEPENTGQGRGNSGVFLGDFEIQVLDSYGLGGFYNECGALYKLAAPMVNMCAPPLQWQTFDIEYQAPRFDAAGERTGYGRMTVHHNGVLIHNDVELVHHTSNSQTGRGKAMNKGPAKIKLQHHGHPVAFRNVWLIER